MKIKQNEREPIFAVVVVLLNSAWPETLIVCLRRRIEKPKTKNRIRISGFLGRRNFINGIFGARALNQIAPINRWSHMNGFWRIAFDHSINVIDESFSCTRNSTGEERMHTEFKAIFSNVIAITMIVLRCAFCLFLSGYLLMMLSTFGLPVHLQSVIAEATLSKQFANFISMSSKRCIRVVHNLHHWIVTCAKWMVLEDANSISGSVHARMQCIHDKWTVQCLLRHCGALHLLAVNFHISLHVFLGSFDQGYNDSACSDKRWYGECECGVPQGMKIQQQKKLMCGE